MLYMIFMNTDKHRQQVETHGGIMGRECANRHLYGGEDYRALFEEFVAKEKICITKLLGVVER